MFGENGLEVYEGMVVGVDVEGSSAAANDGRAQSLLDLHEIDEQLQNSWCL